MHLVDVFYTFDCLILLLYVLLQTQSNLFLNDLSQIIIISNIFAFVPLQKTVVRLFRLFWLILSINSLTGHRWIKLLILLYLILNLRYHWVMLLFGLIKFFLCFLNLEFFFSFFFNRDFRINTLQCLSFLKV